MLISLELFAKHFLACDRNIIRSPTVMGESQKYATEWWKSVRLMCGRGRFYEIHLLHREVRNRCSVKFRIFRKIVQSQNIEWDCYAAGGSNKVWEVVCKIFQCWDIHAACIDFWRNCLMLNRASNALSCRVGVSATCGFGHRSVDRFVRHM